MPKSSLATEFIASPNHYWGRNAPISGIAVHHMAGVMSAADCASTFARKERMASANYSVGNDGSCVCSVDEANAPWTDSNFAIDNRCITIEVSNSAAGGEWPVGEKAWYKLVALCADICRRYGFRLNYTGGVDGTLIEHRMVWPTACPGTYLHDRMKRLATEVNALLESDKGDEKLKEVHNHGGPVYRIYNERAGQHMFTDHEDEKNHLVKSGWKDEGIAWTAPKGGTVPVYRMYNPSAGCHLWTTNFAEASNLQRVSWVYEGVPFFGNESGEAVYRLYNPNSGAHLFTTSADEKGSCVASGWKDEGVAFYV